MVSKMVTLQAKGGSHLVLSTPACFIATMEAAVAMTLLYIQPHPESTQEEKDRSRNTMVVEGGGRFGDCTEHR